MRDQIHCFSDPKTGLIRVDFRARPRRNSNENREWTLNVSDTRRAMRKMQSLLASHSATIPPLRAFTNRVWRFVRGRRGIVSNRYRISPTRARELAISNSIDTIRKPTPKYRSHDDEERGFMSLLMASLIVTILGTQLVDLGLSNTLIVVVATIFIVVALYSAIRTYRISRARAFK